MLATLKKITRKLLGKRESDRESLIIKTSSLFDEEYYLANYPDVRASAIKPETHYLLHGGFEGRNPSAHFDTFFYLEQNPDVKAAGINPLLHYLVYGKNESRLILPVDDYTKEGFGSPNGERLRRWSYPVHLMKWTESNSIKVNYYDHSIKQRSYGNAISHWDVSIQNFWRKYVDRYYEFFVLSAKIKNGYILDIGAEFYNKHIKEVIAKGQQLAIVDIKEPDHPEIRMVNDLDLYQKFDMTADDYRQFPALAGAFDTVLSFGVLSYYDFSVDMCVKYLDNMNGFLKADGMAVFKVDQRAILSHTRFPAFPELHRMICSRFVIMELDILTDANNEYCLYYCRKK
jgi:hypothetical protein